MKFDFDPGKDTTNLSKNGLSLASPAEPRCGAALVWIDDLVDYGEVRMIALASIGDTLFSEAFVDCESARRNISPRRANRREANHYVNAI